MRLRLRDICTYLEQLSKQKWVHIDLHRLCWIAVRLHNGLDNVECFIFFHEGYAVWVKSIYRLQLTWHYQDSIKISILKHRHHLPGKPLTAQMLIMPLEALRPYGSSLDHEKACVDKEYDVKNMQCISDITRLGTH